METDNYSFSKAYKNLQNLVVSSTKKFLFSLTNPETQKVAISSVLFTSTMLVLLVVATIIYSCFYIFTMPKVASSVPVYFVYTPTEMVCQSALNLQAGSRYNLGILLNTPDTQYNFELGNFMIKLELFSSKNKTLVTAIRPAHLKYHSELLRTLKTWYNAISLVLDYKVQQSFTKVELLENYFESSSDPSSSIKLSISNPNIHTYSTKLLVNTHYQGLAYFMYNWWLSTALFFISNIMLAEILCISYLWNIISELFGDGFSEKVGETGNVPSGSILEDANGEERSNESKVGLEQESPIYTASSLAADEERVYSSLAYPRRVHRQSGNFSYPYSTDLFDSNATLNRLSTDDNIQEGELAGSDTLLGAGMVPDMEFIPAGENISDINICDETVGESFGEFDLQGLLK